MLLVIKIILTILLFGLALNVLMLHRNEITFEIVSKDLDKIHNYIRNHLETLTFEEIKNAYSNWLYDYDYVLWRPWLKSAIKPEYLNKIEAKG